MLDNVPIWLDPNFVSVLVVLVSPNKLVSEILLNYFKMFMDKILGSGVLFSWIETQNGYLVCSYFYMFIFL